MPAVRMTQRGKYKKENAKRYLAYKDQVGWMAKAAGVKILNGDIAIDIKIYLNTHVLDGDWDNYSKSICDALNGIAYIDDRQIMEGHCRKVLGVSKKEERVEIELREIRPGLW